MLCTSAYFSKSQNKSINIFLFNFCSKEEIAIFTFIYFSKWQITFQLMSDRKDCFSKRKLFQYSNNYPFLIGLKTYN